MKNDCSSIQQRNGSPSLFIYRRPMKIDDKNSSLHMNKQLIATNYFRTHCVLAVSAAGHGTSLNCIDGLSAFWNQSNRH